MDVGTLRELLRHLQSWQVMFAASAVSDVLTGPDGTSYCLQDITYLYECRSMLSPRQRQAIELCLYQNVLEKEAARIMSVSPTNPVAMYATNGLKRLIEMAEAGQLSRYRPEPKAAA